jgi:hypothetical protein
MVVAAFLPSNLVVAVVISAAGGIFGLVLGWRSLQVAALFPEIDRIPFYARLARLARRGDRGSDDRDDLGG